MRIRRLLALTVLMSVSAGIGKAQSSSAGCPTDPTCDTSSTQCLGYGDMTVKCANGTTVNFGPCYQSDICAIALANQGNDWIKITADNINPKQCHAYSQNIKQNLLAAYNTWCCQSNNFLKCCPNSIGWPVGVTRSAANCMAMQDAPNEVAYVAAAGSAMRTQFFLQLRPKSDSPLCKLLVYSSSATTDRGSSNANSGAVTTASTATSAAAAAASTAAAAATASSTSTAGRTTPAAGGTASAAGSTASLAGGTATTTTTTTAATTVSMTDRATPITTSSAATTTAAPTTTTVSSTSGSSSSISTSSSTTTRASGRRKRRQAFDDIGAESNDMSESDNIVYADADGEVKSGADFAAHSLLRRSASAGIVVTLDATTVSALIADVNVPNLVVTAVAIASNGTVIVTVTVVQNVASATNLTPDRPSYGWIIATGTVAGLIAAILVTYLIASAIHRKASG